MAQRFGFGCFVLVSAVWWAAGCNLNPQPEPPGHTPQSNSFGGFGGNNASAGGGGSGTSCTYPNTCGMNSGSSGNAGTGGTTSGGTGGSGGSIAISDSRWPDSATKTCSDGKMVDDCPNASDAGYGQDGNYHTSPNTYQSVGEEGTQYDPITKLMWARTPLVQQGNSDLQASCSALTLNGMQTWRVPTRLELISLIDFGRSSPAFDPQAFAADPFEPDPYISASLLPDNSMFHWGVAFAYGNVVPITNSVSQSLLRCVAGEPLQTMWQLDVTGETATEGLSKTQWQVHESTEVFTWINALQYCDTLDLAGYSDWRLPSIKELLLIIEDNGPNTAYTPSVFPTSANDEVWSSTPYVADGAQSWTLSLNNGTTSQAPNDSAQLAVRCVR
jgi:hypothetical protein